MNNVISLSAKQWWRSNRWRYNKGLIISGFVAFILYCVLGELIISRHEEFEETIFAMIFQGFFYLVAMGIANLFYSLGWLIDILFNKNDSLLFRKRLFYVGYWFSFSLPILFILGIMTWFLLWGK